MAIHRCDIESLLHALQSGHTLLTPNNRSVDAILREFSSFHQSSPNQPSAWPRPAVFAIDIYLQQLWQAAATRGIAPFFEIDLLDRFNEQLLWIQLLESSYDKYPLLNIEEAANSVARSYQFFKQWDLSSHSDIEQYRNAADFQVFLKWCEEFETLCDERKVASLSDANKLIISNIEKLRVLLPKHLVLVNFKQPPPLYTALFDALASTSVIEWKTQTSDHTAQNLKEALLSRQCTRTRYQDISAEIAACLDWCEDKAKENQQTHIGLIIDHGRTLEPLIDEALFRRSLSNGDGLETAGFLNRFRGNEVLANSPSINFALTILELNNERIQTERFCKILQSANTISADTELQSRLALEIYLRKNVEAKSRLSQLRDIMQHKGRTHHCPILAKALLKFTQIGRQAKTRQPLRQWLHLFSQQLQILGWPGNKTGAAEKSHIQQWRHCAHRLSASSSVLGDISITAALQKLNAFLRQTNSTLHFDEGLQISLVDIEEAQDFTFNFAWIMAVDNRHWPAAINPVSFLPYSLQKKAAMPGCSSQQQFETAITQLIQLRKNTSEELVISYHQLEEELEIRPSALLKNVEFSSVQTSSVQTGSVQTAASKINSEAKLKPAKNIEHFQEKLYIPFLADEKIRGGSSLLSNQSNCPFRAFSSNRLNVSSLDEFSSGLNPIARGNALHLALEKLGKAYKNSDELAQLSAAEKDTMLADCVTPAIKLLRKQYPETMSPAFSALEQTRLIQLLQGFLTLEKTRSNFSIHSVEEKLSWEHSQHSQLSLTFRIDRIDQIEDGSLVLIDYKTGKKTNYKWFDDRPDDLQLPLYQIAVTGKAGANQKNPAISATLICQLNAESTSLFGTTDLDSIHPDIRPLSAIKAFSGSWTELQGRWNTIIYSLIKEFESGLVSVAPARGHHTCQYCDLNPLCRISKFEQRQLSPLKEEPS